MRNNLRYLTGNILVFALTDLVGNFARMLVFPYASLYVLALGGDASRIGWINFIALLASLFILPLAGYITDHVDRIRLIALAGYLSSLFLVLIILAPNWQVLAVAFFLFGTVVFQFPAYSSLVADSLLPQDRGRGIGAMNTISSSLAVFAPYLAGLIIEKYTVNLGMRILYTTMLVCYLVGTTIQLKFLRENSPTPRRHIVLADLVRALGQAYRAFPSLIKQMPTPLKALAWVVLLSFIINGFTSAFWVVFATEQIRLSTAEWGLILLVEAVIKMAAFIPAGWLVDRLGRTKSLLAALLVSLVFQPLFVIAGGFWPVLLIRLVLAFAFCLAIPACMALMADLVPRPLRGQMMAAIGQGGLMIAPSGGAGGPSLGYLFIPPMMLASLVSGYLYLWHPALPWLFALPVTLISIILIVRYIRDPKEAEI